MRLSSLLRWALGLALLVCADVWAAPQARVALVIGNSAYSGVWPDLGAGPAQDAGRMRKVLTDLHFEVLYRENADLPQMEQALDELRSVLKQHPGALALVYYSGHGAQAPAPRAEGGQDTDNFLIPARTDLHREADSRYKALALSRIEDTLRSAGASTGVIILDACRKNGLERDTKATGQTQGLAAQGGANIVVAYAAAPGRYAYGNHKGPGFFTTAVALEIEKPGTLVDALNRARKDVIAETRGRARGTQEPEIRAAGTEPVVLVEAAASPSQPSHSDPRAEELAYLNTLRELPVARRVATCADYRGKVQRGEFPGAFAAPIGELCSSGGTDQPPVTMRAAEPVHPCTVCPEMVAIPPGSFQMGSPASEKERADDEGPVHEVHIHYAFSVSKYPITRREWKAFVKETGHKDPSECPRNPQTDDDPVVCVSWQDAQDYAAWLSTKSGQHYRLLSEGEYEYVNRAGSATAYWWGASPEAQCEHANGADAAAKKEYPDWIYAAACNDGFAHASPVGHFPPNAFGLYDTTGNVYSWTQDCYHESYKGAPADGSAWGGGDKGCTGGWVVRGGSWVTDPARLRAASRNAHSSGDGNVGFRVARSD
jgi:formylglycine-generating enzyme required for sulfatase activity